MPIRRGRSSLPPLVRTVARAVSSSRTGRGALDAERMMRSTGGRRAEPVSMIRWHWKTRPRRSSCVRGRGTETSAEDLVGPPERMVSERRSTAVVRGDPKRSRRQPNGRLRMRKTKSRNYIAWVKMSEPNLVVRYSFEDDIQFIDNAAPCAERKFRAYTAEHERSLPPRSIAGGRHPPACLPPSGDDRCPSSHTSAPIPILCHL